MRVTNEKLTADVYCANRETCDGCEHRRRNCVDNSERNDYARDLLETRELIKEMRKVMVSIQRDESIDAVVFDDFVAKSKDYA